MQNIKQPSLTYAYEYGYLKWFFAIYIGGEFLSSIISLGVREWVQAIYNALSALAAAGLYLLYRYNRITAAVAAEALLSIAWVGMAFHVIYNGYQADMAFLMIVLLASALMLPKRRFLPLFIVQSFLNAVLIAYGYLAGYEGVLRDVNIMASLAMVYVFASAIAFAYTYTIAHHIERLQAALERNTLLLREVHHRVKNNLNRLSTLVYLEESGAMSQEREKLRRLYNRIETMRAAHMLLDPSRKESVLLCRYLRDLVTTWQSDAAMQGREVAINCVSLQVKYDLAVSVGMIVHEFLSNTFKHSVLNDPIRIDVRKRKSALALCYSDGKSVKEGSLGEGLNIVRILVRQHRGHMIKTPHGRAVLLLLE